MRRASGRTKTEARVMLKELVGDHDDGVAIASRAYTVGQAVEDWIDQGLGGRDPEHSGDQPDPRAATSSPRSVRGS